MNIENVIFQTLHTLSVTEFDVIKEEFNSGKIGLNKIILQLSEKANRTHSPEELEEAKKELGAYIKLSGLERAIDEEILPLTPSN